MHVIGNPWRRVGVRQKKTFEEIMATNFPKIMKTINPQMQKFQRTPSTRNMKKIKLNHLTINLLKTNNKEKSSKPIREKDKLHTEKWKLDFSSKSG